MIIPVNDKTMKRTITTFVIIALFQVIGSAQCFDFAKQVCKTKLSPYVHDGNFNSTILKEGQEAEFFKTFYAGQKYRIVITSEEELQIPEFEIMDKSRKVIYTNKGKDQKETYDFELDKSQQLIISIKVPRNEKPTEKPAQGCVSIVFGFQNQS